MIEFRPIFGVFFDQIGDQSRKRRFYEKPIKTYRKTTLLQGLGHAFGDQNPQKNDPTIGMDFGGIFNEF